MNKKYEKSVMPKIEKRLGRSEQWKTLWDFFSFCTCYPVEMKVWSALSPLPGETGSTFQHSPALSTP